MTKLRRILHIKWHYKIKPILLGMLEILLGYGDVVFVKYMKMEYGENWREDISK